ncbi:aminotransferase class IV [Paenibacillus sanguinis]|uniref:aminotransferase class IV n=1 Tax=Paenibacillus sanguinis TaxID=225906 RepID=UPI000360DA06|nr:aminotransferase class IV [Paenibacillus sanguinis]
MNYIGVDGVPTPADQAVISVMDHGLMYGIGLFETFRTYGGRPFLLERHIQRLQTGCRTLGIEFAAKPEDITAEIIGLLRLNGLNEGYIRYTVTAGDGPLGLPVGNYAKPRIIIYVKPLPETRAALYTKGKPLWRLTTRRNTPEGELRLKSLHYMNSMLAKRELVQLEAIRLSSAVSATSSSRIPAEGLQLTADDSLAEGVVSNLFFVEGRTLYTPDIGTGILPGITRAVILELAARQGVKVEEGRYTWSRLLNADEVFMTNSIQELVPITELWWTVSGAEPETGELLPRSHIVGEGHIGPITSRLLGDYREKARDPDAT